MMGFEKLKDLREVKSYCLLRTTYEKGRLGWFTHAVKTSISAIRVHLVEGEVLEELEEC